MGLLSVGMAGSLILVPSLEALFFLLVCLIQIQSDGFICLFVLIYPFILFAKFCICILEAYSFLIREIMMGG